MKQKLLRILWPVAIIAALVATYRLYQSTNRLHETIAQVNRQNVERAVQLAETALEDLVIPGQCAPSRTAATLVEQMRAHPAPRAEIEEGGKPIGLGIEFHEAQPFGPWQVVVVPDEARRLIRIEGYGKDLATPLVVKEVACP